MLTRGDYITSSFVPMKTNLKIIFQHSEPSSKRGGLAHLDADAPVEQTARATQLHENNFNS